MWLATYTLCCALPHEVYFAGRANVLSLVKVDIFQLLLLSFLYLLLIH
jgi:hypothetical protein